MGPALRYFPLRIRLYRFESLAREFCMHPESHLVQETGRFDQLPDLHFRIQQGGYIQAAPVRWTMVPRPSNWL